MEESNKDGRRQDLDRNSSNYNEYLMAMKRVHQRQSRDSQAPDMMSPRERRRHDGFRQQAMVDGVHCISEASRISIIASMVPDEIIYKHFDHSVRSYETALMFIDVSGFTDLCESYTKAGRGGPSRLTQVLNSYIGAMVQEILAYSGDVLKFSGDAFLAMWKKNGRLTMQNVVHTAIDCGLVIQKNYGTHVTDNGVVLKVKIAISAGVTYFSIIGGSESSQSGFVIVGQPVWDVKKAEYMSTAGDVLATQSTWRYVNEAWYSTQPCEDGRHTKVIGVGATWKRMEIPLNSSLTNPQDEVPSDSNCSQKSDEETLIPEINYMEFSLRPAVIAAMRSTWWPRLRHFMLAPVIRAVDNDEPMDFLTEVRWVVVVFLNLITKSVTEDVLISVVDTAYKCVLSVVSNSGGLVNKVSMFDKDMMFLVVFGLRGLKHEDEAQKALQCAFQLKSSLANDNIISISIGVTCGTTYCGVVGHVLRREYTVIGAAVNKAARLMMAYPDKVTCDKETFLRSKLDQEYFRLMESKPLKGIAKPGPIYEFNKLGWRERMSIWRHPLLGRNEELQIYKTTLFKALEQQNTSFTRYRDHKFAVAFIGPRQVGKTRLMEECLNITLDYIRVEKVILTEETKVPFGLFRLIVARTFTAGKSRNLRENCENRIRYIVDLSSATATQIYGINTIFDCRFPLPEKFRYTGELLDDFSVKRIIQKICKANYADLWVLAVEEAQHTDNESWRLLLLILNTKTLFVLITITDEYKLSPLAMSCLADNMIVKVNLTGVDRCYHAALACQMLDVQAIPADLEKVIESASGGMPGWIQNFVISLVQRGALTVVTLPRSEALASGAVMPSPALLQRASFDVDDTLCRTSYQSIYSVVSASLMSKADSAFPVQDTDIVQMAVLAESYHFEDLTVDMAMDVIILKTYDSLTPFEKMLLKCASVLGNVFSRAMLLHLLQSESSRKVAQAVAKLFTIRVLECEGGDFTKNTSTVLVHPAPAMPNATPPYCACIGIREPPNCRDLPVYACCGYLKFRHSLFRTTTYELLTESQKLEMHARALMFLERYTRRCAACGSGCFIKLLGLRCDDGLIEESEELKRTREQICALSAETRVPGEMEQALPFVHINASELRFNVVDRPSFDILETEGNSLNRILETRTPRPSSQISRKDKRVRSFSSLELDTCECLSILLSVYCHLIDHCRGAAEHQKLFEAYLEYADLNIITMNIPQAVRLLFEVETFVRVHKFYIMNIEKDWMMNFQMARIASLRSICMLESGDLREARNQLLEAMKLYCVPFPTSKRMVRLANMRASFRQSLALCVIPNCYIATDKGLTGIFYDDIARTLNNLFRLFTESKEEENATLAAKMALSYALRTNSNFRVLCVCYGNLISTYRQQQKFSMSLKFEKRALELCHRKRGNLDVTEVQAVCYLYTNIFLFYVEYGKKLESLEFGLSVMHMMTNLIDLNTRQMLIVWMLKLLLSDLRIIDMVAIMREFLYMTDSYDLSSETWFYYYTMVIHLDTGYCVETYGTCERFYIKKGDAILRSKTPEAAWNFFVSMWLMTIRVGAWEKAIIWEENIKQIMKMNLEKHEFHIMILVRLVEGLLITLVKEMDNRNIKKIIVLQKSVQLMFEEMSNACNHSPMFRPRYYLLKAYNLFIKGRKMRAYHKLDKAREQAKQHKHGAIRIWAEHTRNMRVRGFGSERGRKIAKIKSSKRKFPILWRSFGKKHWKGTLPPKLVNYWTEHAEAGNTLDYRDYDPTTRNIVPYTLPLPRDLEK